jgi:hypothetical protein
MNFSLNQNFECDFLKAWLDDKREEGVAPTLPFRDWNAKKESLINQCILCLFSINRESWGFKKEIWYSYQSQTSLNLAKLLSNSSYKSILTEASAKRVLIPIKSLSTTLDNEIKVHSKWNELESKTSEWIMIPGFLFKKKNKSFIIPIHRDEKKPLLISFDSPSDWAIWLHDSLDNQEILEFLSIKPPTRLTDCTKLRPSNDEFEESQTQLF